MSRCNVLRCTDSGVAVVDRVVERVTLAGAKAAAWRSARSTKPVSLVSEHSHPGISPA